MLAGVINLRSLVVSKTGFERCFAAAMPISSFQRTATDPLFGHSTATLASSLREVFGLKRDAAKSERWTGKKFKSHEPCEKGFLG